MKTILAFFLLAALAFGQTSAVYKNSSTNEVTGSLVFGSGKSLSATGTGTIAATSAPASGITGQLAVANGGTGATTASAARTHLDVYSKADTAAFTYNLTNSRRPTQGLVFDGTAGATWAGYAPGTSGFTLHSVFRLNSLSAVQEIFDGNNSILVEVKTTGAVLVYDRKASAIIYQSSAGLVSAGVTYALTYARGALYLNGALVAGSLTDSSDYSSITAIGASYAGAQPFNGSLGPVSIINAALSAAEVATLAETGRLPSWCHSAQVGQPAGVGLITGDNSTFASDTGFWTKGAGVTISGGAANLPASGGTLYKTLLVKPGYKYRVSVTVSNYTGGTVNYSDAQFTSIPFASGNGTFTFDFQQSVAAVNGALGFQCTGGGTASIDNVTLTPLGSVLNLDPNQPGSGNVWSNTNGTGDAIAPASGVTWAVPGTGSTRLRTTTATNGNQQLYGTSIIPGVAQIIRVRAKAASGTPTVTLGNASGGSQIVTSVALSTSWKNLTIVSGGEITSTANLWASSTSTDTVYWDIEVQSFNN